MPPAGIALSLIHIYARGQLAGGSALLAHIAQLAGQGDIVPVPGAVGVLAGLVLQHLDAPVVYAAFDLVADVYKRQPLQESYDTDMKLVVEKFGELV